MAKAVLLSRKTRIRLPKQDLWSFLADTDRLNRTIDLSPVHFAPTLDRRRKGHYSAETRSYGRRVRYEEFPFEWIEGRFYEVLRRFSGGPLTEISTGVRLHPAADDTEVEVFARIVPRTWFGAIVARTLLARTGIRKTVALAHALEQHNRDPQAHAVPALPPPERLDPGRLELRTAQLSRSHDSPNLIARLESHLRTGSDLEVTGMRPFELADRWGADRMELLYVFLHAADCGLLDLTWSVLCPVCRTVREDSGRLRQLPSRVHCDTCDIAFDTDLARSVEIRFDVNPAVRRAERARYCIGGPANSPSVVAQLRLEPGEQRSERLDLDAGWLRLRCYQVGSPVSCDVGSTGAALTVECGPGELRLHSAPVTDGSIHLEVANRLPGEALIVVERERWKDAAATGALVMSLEGFTDLFPDQGVAPGDEIGIANLAVLFTDLSGSTALYERIGDVRAFAFVQSHFRYLRDAVVRENGGVVKQMGDAVMATFADAREAWAAAASMQAGWDDFRREHLGADDSVLLKVGLHQGPAVMIDNEGSVDYFGATVNLAARVQGCANGGDIVLSRAVHDDPEVGALLALPDYRCDVFTAGLKGIDEEQTLWRLRRP
ncbi:adenylate/guanylate cyclase domain-containing protein [Rhodococcus sp. WS4]|nr:adenylate/guanylate cyclase domain-containing protein [Rhodococcus sp. WS4]